MCWWVSTVEPNFPLVNRRIWSCGWLPVDIATNCKRNKRRRASTIGCYMSAASWSSSLLTERIHCTHHWTATPSLSKINRREIGSKNAVQQTPRYVRDDCSLSTTRAWISSTDKSMNGWLDGISTKCGSGRRYDIIGTTPRNEHNVVTIRNICEYIP